MHNYMQTLEVAVQHGLPVLLKNVAETLDASLDPILNKAIMKIGNVYSKFFSLKLMLSFHTFVSSIIGKFLSNDPAKMVEFFEPFVWTQVMMVSNTILSSYDRRCTHDKIRR